MSDKKTTYNSLSDTVVIDDLQGSVKALWLRGLGDDGEGVARLCEDLSGDGRHVDVYVFMKG